MNKVNPPKYAIENAKRALKCLKQGSKAMTSVGRNRAKQLANNKTLSMEDLKAINSFRRHKKNARYKGDVCKDKGAVAWLGWGLGYKNKKPNERFSDWARRELYE